MADFEWSWPTRIERDVIERTLTLDFLAEATQATLETAVCDAQPPRFALVVPAAGAATSAATLIDPPAQHATDATP
jgi:hypothetical protein